MGKLRFREGIDSREGKEKEGARGESEGKELRKRLKMVKEAQPEIEKPRKKNSQLWDQFYFPLILCLPQLISKSFVERQSLGS